MRRGHRKPSKKLYAAGYLKDEVSERGGIGRHAVLAVCNVVAATGLLGLLTYNLLIDSDTEERVHSAQIDVEATRPVAGSPLRTSFAGLTPRLAEDAGPDRALDSAPLFTSSVRRPVARKQSAPIDASVVGGLQSINSPGVTVDPNIAVANEVRRVVIGEEAAPQPSIRVASLGSVSDLLPNDRRGAYGDDLSTGSLFQEPRSGKSNALFYATPAPAPVPLLRRDEGSDVLMLSFVVPAHVVPTIDPEARNDLLRADEVNRKSLPEKKVTKNRRVARERYCLASAIYYEARGESTEGQKAVAQVVLNRVDDRRYPGTICGVVFEGENRRHRCQFSFACDGKPERPRPGKSWTKALDLAEEFTNGYVHDPVKTATHYHADYVRPRWSRHRDMTRIRKIGRHIFYNES